MSNRFFVSAAIVLTLVSTGTFSRAWSLSDLSDEIVAEGSSDARQPAEKRLKEMSELLDLSEDQIASVRKILGTERKEGTDQRKNLRKMRNEMREAIEIVPFDEEKIRTIAVRQAKLKIELTVLRARAHSSILAILTPEQKTLFEKVRPLLKPRHDSKRPRRGAGQ